MVWYIIAAALLVLSLTILIVNFIRDMKYLKKSVKETMSAAVAKEIETEREQNARLRDEFRAALKKAGQGTVPPL